MSDQIAFFISSLSSSSELVTVALAALPILELRGAIPFATFVLNMNWQSAFFWSFCGNILPVPFILLLLGPAEKFLSQTLSMNRFFEWLFNRTQRKGKVIERYKAIGLILFVAIPLPVTGAWTGAVAAYIFGIRFLPAFVSICLGVAIAGVIVTLACQGVIGFWDLSHKF